MFVAPAVKTNKSVALTILTRQSVLTAHSLVSDNILCSVSVCRVLALLVTFNMSQVRAGDSTSDMSALIVPLITFKFSVTSQKCTAAVENSSQTQPKESFNLIYKSFLS